MATRKHGNMDFEKIIADGALAGAAGGFNAQTVNGTSEWKGTGWNKDFDWNMPQLEPDATRPAGRNNRTAE